MADGYPPARERSLAPALLMLAGKWNWWPGDTEGLADEEATTKNTKHTKGIARKPKLFPANSFLKR